MYFNLLWYLNEKIHIDNHKFCIPLLGITLVDEAKDDDEEDETSPELVAGVQLAYSKRKPQRKVHTIINYRYHYRYYNYNHDDSGEVKTLPILEGT